MKSETSEIKMWTTNQVVLATLFVVCVFLSFWLLYRFRAVVFLFFIAITLGTTIRPAVEWFYRRGISRPTGIITIYILIACFLAGFLALFVPIIVDQATLFSQRLPHYEVQFRQSLLGSNNLLLRNIGARLQSQFVFFGTSDPTAEEVLGQVNRTFHYAGLVINGLLSALAVFLLAYYWTQESSFVIRNLLRLVPRARRSDVREIIQKMEVKIGGYLRGQAILCLAVGSAAFIAYALIGLPYTLLLAIFAGLMELIPIVGPALGAVPAALVAIAIMPEKVIWVAVATMIIQAIENILLVPRIMKNSMGVHPIIILLSLITFNAVFGLLGAILALPLAAILQLILERIIFAASESTLKVQSDDEFDLQSLINESEAMTRLVINQANPNGDSSLALTTTHAHIEVVSIARELDELLKKIKREEEES